MNIFIGNLSAEITEESLHKTFALFGDVTATKIIKNHATGQSKGYGFVEMPNEPEALSAVDTLHRTEMNGKRLIVDVAKFQRNKNFPMPSRHRKIKKFVLKNANADSPQS